MKYTVKALAKMSGVSARTLRYYDQIGLLVPAREHANGYRMYGKDEVDKLQQILFYRELGIDLCKIKKILTLTGWDVKTSLQNHKKMLMQKRKRIDSLIWTIEKTIKKMEGEIEMTDSEKFEGFKQETIKENEKKYGKEIRGKYGDEMVDASNDKMKNMTKKQYENMENVQAEFEQTLKLAFETKNPKSELAQKTCELHKQWLSFFYDKYSKEYHKNLGEMYVADERFRANYDKIAPGCTEFLRDAIHVFCEKQ